MRRKSAFQFSTQKYRKTIAGKDNIGQIYLSLRPLMSSGSNRVLGYAAGIIAGASYGMNPLFAKPLLAEGIGVPTMLFWRYFLASLFMAGLMLLRKESFSLRKNQILTVILLGVLFSFSSIFLFEAYKYIPSGLATTLVYLYPTLSALILLFFGEKVDLKTWLCIAATLGGVVLLCLPSGGVKLNAVGMILAGLSALSYAFYLVIINKSARIASLSAHTITFYALLTGSVLFLAIRLSERGNVLSGLDTPPIWLNLTGLAFFPTMVSLLALAISTRSIGAAKTGVLGVFEPLTAILIGTLLFSEPLTVNIVIGIIVCISAVTFLVAGGGNKKSGCKSASATK